MTTSRMKTKFVSNFSENILNEFEKIYIVNKVIINKLWLPCREHKVRTRYWMKNTLRLLRKLTGHISNCHSFQKKKFLALTLNLTAALHTRYSLYKEPQIWWQLTRLDHIKLTFSIKWSFGGPAIFSSRAAPMEPKILIFTAIV